MNTTITLTPTERKELTELLIMDLNSLYDDVKNCNTVSDGLKKYDGFVSAKLLSRVNKRAYSKHRLMIVEKMLETMPIG